MIDIIDFNGAPKSDRDGTYCGAAGSKDGIIYNDEYWILKYPKNTRSFQKQKRYTLCIYSRFCKGNSC